MSCVPNIASFCGLCLLSSKVWFSGVPDKDKDEDKENNTAKILLMYVIFIFHKVKERVQIEKCRVLFTQYEFRDTFFSSPGL